MAKKRIRHESPVRTGFPAGMLQDDDRRLSCWLANQGCARELAREAADAIRKEWKMSEEHPIASLLGALVAWALGIALIFQALPELIAADQADLARRASVVCPK